MDAFDHVMWPTRRFCHAERSAAQSKHLVAPFEMERTHESRDASTALRSAQHDRDKWVPDSGLPRTGHSPETMLRLLLERSQHRRELLDAAEVVRLDPDVDGRHAVAGVL